MRVALVLGAAYLLGSIPFAWLVVRAVGGGDIRQRGSGNVGATNVMRTSGVLAGLAALVPDIGKGVAAVALARVAGLGENGVAASGLLAVVGHVFPVWLRGHGGKGVATAAGVFMLLAPKAFGVAIVAFAIAIVATGYVSLGSIVASLALVTAVVLSQSPRATAVEAIAAALLIILRHADNMRRMRRGAEPRISVRRRRTSHDQSCRR